MKSSADASRLVLAFDAGIGGLSSPDPNEREHAGLGRAIMAHDGTIEHFAGDGVMILFNAPVPVDDHELQAIRMTLSMRAYNVLRLRS